MRLITSPARETRARAYATIITALGAIPDPGRPLLTTRDGFWEPSNKAIEALIALETAFGVEIDVDEACGLRLPALLDLVEARAAGEPRPIGLGREPLVWDAARGVFIFPHRDGAGLRAANDYPIPRPVVPRRSPVANWRGHGRVRAKRTGALLSNEGRLHVALIVGALGVMGLAAFALRSLA